MNTNATGAPRAVPDASFDTILVPLDGSIRAQQAIPVAEQLARATASEVLLVRVVSVTRWNSAGGGSLFWPSPSPYDAALASEREAAQAYLLRAASMLDVSQVWVKTLTVEGEPAARLLEMASGPHIGVVVLASHGRTGLSRLALGSVADHLVQRGRVPVMVVHVSGDDHHPTHLKHALVPLDGSPLAETALPMLLRLVGRIVHTVTLVRVVDPDWPAAEASEAQDYLEKARKRLIAQSGEQNCTVDVDVRYGQVAEQILRRSEQDCDVIMMATHRRSGLMRWALGSVVEHILQDAKIPVLLVPEPLGAQTPSDGDER